MTPTLTTKLVLLAVVVAGLVGLADASIDRAWDHLVMFLIVAVLAGSILVKLSAGRQVIRLRPDHVTWLTRRAAITGEPVEHVADRAVATYRYALADDGADEHAAT